MKLPLLYFVTIFIIPVFEASQFRCDYTYFPNADGWFKLHTTPSNWDYAKQTCSLEGAELVAPTSDTIKQAVQSLMKKEKNIPAVYVDMRILYPRKEIEAPQYLYDNSIPTNKVEEEEIQILKVEEELMIMMRNGSYTRAYEFWYPFVCHKRIEDITEYNKDCGTFDLEYMLERRTGLCYKFHRLRSSWYEALLRCSGEGGNLAIINSDIEAEVFQDIFEMNPSDSIPGVDWRDSAFVGIWTLKGQHWSTIYGDTLSEAGYDKWSPGEPNNAEGDEFCGSVGRNGLLFDDPCSRAIPFICEREVKADALCEDWERISEDSSASRVRLMLKYKAKSTMMSTMKYEG